uniref:Uncharacterized protein n=1 Tax=Anguilla anguilla TaxID=7936 RepID=A0A0E9U695_ANGAN
MLVLSNRSNQR